ncbi:WD40 repeat-like protein [Tothia fuscella]|uniref:WD40 repeat-like protein n=1 Tax=Tothia fuscella TaxID=1048955 RepID=A0A9P4NR79_9PEZI|nr:WD40 repeat-like protein [Tothia fuscella]
MSSFFTTPASQRKRKRADAPTSSSKRRTISQSNYQGGTKQERVERREKEDEISSDEDEESDVDVDGGAADINGGHEDSEASSSGDEGETQDERRTRLAQRYLDSIAKEVADPTAFDAAEIDRDLIAERLKEDAAETKGRLHRKIAGEFDFPTAEASYFKSSGSPVTGVAVCAPYAYTVGKDASVTKWDLADPVHENRPDRPTNIAIRKKPTPLKTHRCRNPNPNPNDPKFLGHTSAIKCVAVSASGKYLATGGLDKRLVIWDAVSLKPLQVFTQHRDTVLAVSFRRGSHTLYSASADRTIKIWGLDEMAYIETLFGHQDDVVDVAGMAQERCVSVGSRDRTARLWKIVEESQLVFRGGGSTATRTNKNDQSLGTGCGEGNIDRVAAIDEDMFVTGSDNGSISLWNVQRKKPIHTITLAHGLDPQLTPAESSAEQIPGSEVSGRPMPRWITALATIPLSDLILSGSWDGFVRAWRVSADRRRLERVGIVGHADDNTEENAVALNGLTNGDGPNGHTKEKQEKQKLAVGVINDIAVVERGERGKDGLSIVVALGKEHRLGSYKMVQGKNGAVVLEVKKTVKRINDEDVDAVLTNGIHREDS